ncbi:hypothetical protein HG535_0A02720 [Zygotorulaspora mrakii]|uniref:RING-type E3 ubiquitin transferase n=1 Tax=Zygotorulaspora mrakii TaxID=42260 RepID=A0A7H9AVX0_ZYGMR|nr:uncharacterized protein HG535_0A02720 [Zygotorulaspora mrakii]QLG70333.1 hypothetical protein HG535_0A02720 [Zygotorulaspora mrakii]
MFNSSANSTALASGNGVNASTNTGTSTNTNTGIRRFSGSGAGSGSGNMNNIITSGISPGGASGSSGSGQQRRRRGSGLNTFLNTFGIRQSNTSSANNNNASGNSGNINGNNGFSNSNVIGSDNGSNTRTATATANTLAAPTSAVTNTMATASRTASNSSGRFDPLESSNVATDFDPPQINAPALAHTSTHSQSFHRLPISISLTAQPEPSMPQNLQVRHRSSVSASTSPIGQLGSISNPVVSNQPITDIDPLNPDNQGSNSESHNDNNSNSSGGGNMNNNLATNNSNGGTELNNIASLKSLRHYIYAADQPNADELLNLDLPRNSALPEPVDEAGLQQRKDKHGLFSIRLTPFIDNSFSTNSGLAFDPIIRTAGPGSQLVIGRYTERVREAISNIPEQYHPVVFKSKVVSRTHGCFKVDSDGNWYIKDVRSSSGTFLNHIRLSPASTLSKDTLVHDGDVLQLGMDFRGGTEEIYRCVKIRVELNRSWKRRANAFNKEALQRIRNLQLTMGIEEEDCSICLSKIKPCQAMFISPCSHCWHFQCIRRILMTSYPQFVCPNCRATCDLEASLENSDSESESDSDGGQLVDELGVLLEDPKDINMD